MTDIAYAEYSALDPFFDIVLKGLTGLVDGNHFFDAFATDAVTEFRYNFPGWPTTLEGLLPLKELYAGYGQMISLKSADGLVVHPSVESGIVVLEYDVHGNIVASGAEYSNRFISVITIRDRHITHWRDYMDSLTAMNALTGVAA